MVAFTQGNMIILASFSATCSSPRSAANMSALSPSPSSTLAPPPAEGLLTKSTAQIT